MGSADLYFRRNESKLLQNLLRRHRHFAHWFRTSQYRKLGAGGGGECGVPSSSDADESFLSNLQEAKPLR